MFKVDSLKIPKVIESDKIKKHYIDEGHNKTGNIDFDMDKFIIDLRNERYLLMQLFISKVFPKKKKKPLINLSIN